MKKQQRFSSLKSQKTFTKNFHKMVVWFWLRIKLGTQKIANLLGDADKSSKFATRIWYVINDQNNTDYGEGNENGITVKFEIQVIKSNIRDYSHAYILVTGDITATGGDANTRVTFKNCAPFMKCITHINKEHVDGADNLNIMMPMYKLVEITIIIQTLQGVYGSLKETNKIWAMETLLMLLQLIHHRLDTIKFFLNH